MKQAHQDRAHARLSASGAERWVNCPGSVSISDGIPDKSNPYAEEGTEAHEVLEAIGQLEILKEEKNKKPFQKIVDRALTSKRTDMISYARRFVDFVVKKAKGALILLETKVDLKFIHPDIGGTFDLAIVEFWGTLHVFDYKFGTKFVSPKKNLQMIVYAVGLAQKYDWEFQRVRMWIEQPRVGGYDGPQFWEISIEELREYVDILRTAAKRVDEEPHVFKEGDWCYWCKANTVRKICPLKQKAKKEEHLAMLEANPFMKGASYNGKAKSVSQKGVAQVQTKTVKVEEPKWRKAFGKA